MDCARLVLSRIIKLLVDGGSDFVGLFFALEHCIRLLVSECQGGVSCGYSQKDNSSRVRPWVSGKKKKMITTSKASQHE
jgi:hypothetical protein